MSNPAGTTLSGVNSFGGPGSDTFTVGGPGTGSHVGAIFGNLGRNIPTVRGPFQQQWDFFVTKTFPFKEKYAVQFRSDFFNLFNHPNFVITNASFGSAAFGIYDTTAGNPRIAQLALRFTF